MHRVANYAVGVIVFALLVLAIMLLTDAALAQQPQPTDAEKIAACRAFVQEVRAQRDGGADEIAGLRADLKMLERRIQELEAQAKAAAAPAKDSPK